MIIEETDRYIVLWKPQNIPSTPTEQHPESVITELIKYRKELTCVTGYKSNEYGLLNRLDTETAGVVLIAKTNAAFQQLSQAMAAGKIIKTYLAFCYNTGSQKTGLITLPIAHHRKKRHLMVIADKKPYRGKPQYCETYFEKLSDIQARQIWQFYLKDKIGFPDLPVTDEYTWIKCVIKKGKRHQIRLHLSSVGYPIVGDALYSQKKNPPSWVSHHQLYAVGLKICIDDDKQI